MTSRIFFEIKKILTDGGVDENEARAESTILITSISNQSIEEIYTSESVKNEDKIFEAAHKRVKTKLPIQYILGVCKFMNTDFMINNSVLIPRDETELLVRKTIEIINSRNSAVHILDIGCGSGIISCMCAKLAKNAQVMGVDISTQALEVSINNMENLGLVGKVVFRKSDIFSSLRKTDKFDIIVSNPPYIPSYKKETLQDEVKKFEPPLALFTDDEDGLYFYRKIIKEARNYLNEDGHILFEAGLNQASLISELFSGNGYQNVQTFKDISGIERVIKASV